MTQQAIDKEALRKKYLEERDKRLRPDGNAQYLEIKGQFGHYLEKTRECRKCHASWPDYEEKMTDVNIAIQLLLDALDDAFDVALVISGDSDLTTPIHRVRQRFPAKRVIVAFPPRRYSSELKRCASGYLSIGEDKLRANQLPDSIVKPDGFMLQRPITWR